MTLTIAVDAMGGDFGPSVTVSAALRVAREQRELRLILVGDETTLRAALSAQTDARGKDQIEVKHASQIVQMDESPSQALRGKKDSSMRVAINLVKEERAHACVSAGNTGALMATARFVLKTLPGVDRPAIANALPTMRGHTHMLDLGANVDVTADQLVQFAVMGSVLAEAVDGRHAPSVGLLNVGEEDIKGNEQVKEAAKRLAATPLNYAGFVEGDDIFKGTVDVVVCDGFVGNVALKTSEGVAKMISHFMRQSFERSLLTKAVGLLALPVLRDFRQRIDPRRYNGASLLGLAGIVIKSHGGADVDAFAWAIRGAVTEAVKSVPQRISDRVASLLVERQAV